MATNRYTNITPSQFNPLSMQEILLVPGMKRAQHDQMIQDAKSKILNIDNHSIHQDLADRTQMEYDEYLDNFVNKLNSEGVGPASTQDAIALNRRYQELTGPGGVVPELAAWKKSILEGKENFYKDPNSKEYGRPQTDGYFDQQMANYIERYNQTGRGEVFTPEMMPKFYNSRETINKGMQNIGHILNKFTHLPEDQQPQLINGKYVIKRGGHNDIETKSNLEQLNAALNSIRAEVGNPHGSSYQSFQLQGLFEPSGYINSETGEPVSNFERMLQEAVKSRIVQEDKSTRREGSYASFGDYKTPETPRHFDNQNSYSNTYYNVDGNKVSTPIQKNLSTLSKMLQSRALESIGADVEEWTKEENKRRKEAGLNLVTQADQEKYIMESKNNPLSGELSSDFISEVNSQINDDPNFRALMRSAGYPINTNKDGSFSINLEGVTNKDFKDLLFEINQMESPEIFKANNQIITPVEVSGHAGFPGKKSSDHDKTFKMKIQGSLGGKQNSKAYYANGKPVSKSDIKKMESATFHGLISADSQQFRDAETGTTIYGAQKGIMTLNDGTNIEVYVAPETQYRMTGEYRKNKLISEMTERATFMNLNSNASLNDLSKESRELIRSQGFSYDEMDNIRFGYDANTKRFLLRETDDEGKTITPSRKLSSFEGFINKVLEKQP